MPENEAPTKPWWASKTFLANGVLILGGIATSAGLTWFADISNDLLMVVTGLAGIALRFATKKPVSLS